MEQYLWDDVPREQVSPTISRQLIHTPHTTMARIFFKKGSSAPLHHHINEQVTNVLSGELQLEVEGVKETLVPGNVVRVPGAFWMRRKRLKTQSYLIYLHLQGLTGKSTPRIK